MKQAALFEIAAAEKPQAEPQIRPHAARFLSECASPLLRAQAENDKAQARLGFDAFDLPLFQATGRRDAA
jgi:hypothetical protein